MYVFEFLEKHSALEYDVKMYAVIKIVKTIKIVKV